MADGLKINKIPDISGVTDLVVLQQIDGPIDEGKAIKSIKREGQKVISRNLSSDNRPANPDEWNVFVKRQSNFVHELKSKLNQLGVKPRMHLFCHAPLTFALHLGFALSGWLNVIAYQFEKTSGEWVCWGNQEWMEPVFTTEGLPDKNETKQGPVVLMISMTHDVEPKVRKMEIYHEDLASIHLKTAKLGHEAISSAGQAISAAKQFRDTLDRISNIFPNATSIHLFYSGPVALAALFGQQINLNVHPSIALYEFSRSEDIPYRKTITLGLKEEILGMTTETISQAFIKDPFQNTPLLSYYSEKLKNHPLSGKQVLSLLHFLRDLIPFLEAMKKLGLDPSKSHFFFKEYPYPQRDAIAGWLKKQGAHVHPVKQLNSELEVLSSKNKVQLGEILIIEDGGHIYSRILRDYPSLLNQIQGCVEQTTRGIQNIKNALNSFKVQPDLPVLSVAGSKLKEDFEPPHVAEAVVRNIRSFLEDINFRGREVALLGYGTIGQKLAERLKDEGMRVVVYDPDDTKRLKARNASMGIADNVEQAVKDEFLVIGSSGECVLGRAAILSLKHRTYLASASSEQYEFAISELRNLSGGRTAPFAPRGKVVGTVYTLRKEDREIVLLANGYPVNFWGLNSMPDQASDLVLTLLLISLVSLATGNTENPGIDADYVNKLADTYKVARVYLEHHAT